MANRNLPLPTRDECYSLTDDQCRSIQLYQDPHNHATKKEWESEYQAQLIRHYMFMLSFKQIEDQMKPKLTWTYKTYQNRFKDWQFPLDRIERELTVRTLFDKIRSQEGYRVWTSISPQRHISQNRPLQPLPEPIRVPKNFFQQTDNPPEYFPGPDARLSISTTGTFASGSTSYSQYDDSFSSQRASIATTSSSFSFHSSSGIQYPSSFRPKHDPIAGLWNNVLQVIPCNNDHTSLSWNVPSFNHCPVCGYSRWHSLMVHAQSIGIDNFRAAMTVLRGNPWIDFAGNHPIHYLMSAGVGVEFFTILQQWGHFIFPRNVFDQNPLHVLNPLGLGEQLISFLEWLRSREDPPTLFDQRDINCQTPLQTLLLWPLDRHIYSKILTTFPFAEQHLHSLDNSGRSIVTRIQERSLKIKAQSASEYYKLQAGITEIKLYLSAEGRTQNRAQQYGFHDIARGARGLTYFGIFKCYICQDTNSHTNSYWDQISCAIEHARDRYEPDDTGMTPAHALVIHTRCNNDPENTPETAAQTAQLFEFLVPGDDPKLDEVLHALDPEGNSLVYNIAIRGLDTILARVLYLEQESRRRSMVNFCTRSHGRELSILDAVHRKVQETRHTIENLHGSKNAREKKAMTGLRDRLVRCKLLLNAAGAVSRPDNTMRWQIHFN